MAANIKYYMKFKWQFTRCFEKGYLYILLAGAVFLCFVLNDKIGPLWDWSKEFAYFDYIKTSLVAFHKVPFFVWYPNDNLKDYQQIVSSSIFLANPEPLSFFPLIYLLRYLPPIIFIKIYFFIFFLFGVASCFLLKKRMAWGDKQFRTYLILFLFSPLIIQRLSDGYTSFVNLFLFPLLIYFNLSPKIIPRILGQAGIIGFIVLNSGVHVAVWLFVFLLIQAVCRAVVEKRVMAVLEFAVIAVFVLCLAFIRFYISYKLLGGMRQPLCAGYNPAVFLFWAITPFISVFPFNLMFVHRIIGGVAAWEGSLFMGLALPMFAIMYFHLIKNYKDKNKSVPDNIGILLVVGFLLMLMSMEPLYKSLISFFARFMPVDSLISADKYPFRYMIPSYLLMSLGLAQLIVPVEGYIKNLFVKFSCTKLKRVILKILALISYFICAISALLFTALLFFKNLFINFIAGRVSASYQNQDDWLSLLVQFKAHNLDYYIEKLRSEFAAGTWGFFVLFVFSLLIILLIKHRNRIRDYFVFIPNVFLEFALAIPIFFVCNA